MIPAANPSIRFGAKPLLENVPVTFGNGQRWPDRRKRQHAPPDMCVERTIEVSGSYHDFLQAQMLNETIRAA